MVDKFNLSKVKYESIQTSPEYPITNYSTNYIKGVLQLKLLIEVSMKSLKTIKTSTLIIQADQDPVVNPKSARIILNEIGALIRSFMSLLVKDM